MFALAEKPVEMPVRERLFTVIRGGVAEKSGPSGGTLSPDELHQRVAVLKRFRELLKAQRDRFQNYLEVLEKQKDAIEQGNTEEITGHVELEEQIVADIFSIQRVINPLEELYRTLSPAALSPGAALGEDDVPDLQSALEKLKTEAATRSRRNRDLLSHRMTELTSEIAVLRTNNPYRGGRSVYAAVPAPSVIDIRG